MDTKIYTENDLKEAAALLKKGELVAFPTETVYGLGADATNEAAVKSVYRAKGRPSDNPLILHVDSLAMVAAFAEKLPADMLKLAEVFWPGPLTFVLPVKAGALSQVVTGGLSTAAFRMPQQPLTLALIHEVGVPLVGPSANTSGRPSPTLAAHVYHDLNGKIAGVLDGGATSIGIESTVLDLSLDEDNSVPLILRPGAITKEMIESVIGSVDLDNHLLKESEAPKSPGMKYQHYAPEADVWMIDEKNANWQAALNWAHQHKQRVAILAEEKIIAAYQTYAAAFYSLGTGSIEEAAHKLYGGLRKLDDVTPKIDLIFAQTFSEDGLGSAYMNRLKKAAAGRFFS